MKKLLLTTWMAALTALVGCQQDNELLTTPETSTTGGKPITVSAYIQGSGGSRVALTKSQDENQNPTVKVAWRNDANNPETFKVYDDNDESVAPIVFTQTTFDEDSSNEFEGTLPETPAAAYTAYYGEKDYDLSQQNGELNQETCVWMTATVTDFTQPIRFEHQTAILKPTFQVNGTDVNTRITKIVVRGVNHPKSTDNALNTLTVRPSQLDHLYLFLPASVTYASGSTLSFEVTTDDTRHYEATLTIPADMSIEKGKFYTADITLTETIPYVTFSALEEQEMVIPSSSITVDMQYSVNGSDWEDLVTYRNYTFGSTHGDLRLRAKSEIGTSNESVSYKIWFTNSTPVACRGDIRTLVDWENYATADTDNARFKGLFSNCSQLTSAPDLPATTLAESCYEQMFYGCTSLTTAPELPATTLAESCYYYMFYGCKSLTTAPELPATTLANKCYFNMFSGCTSLTTAPKLSATTLAESCYEQMFYGCTSLTTAPELRAPNLAKYCYYNMFWGCTSLTTAPELRATTLAESCYYNMFRGCTSLTTAPELPATTLASGCYQSMFSGCTSLTTAPELPATTLESNCYDSMFSGCTQLTSAPDLPATTLAEYCYYQMFYGCTSLNSITMLATDISANYCFTFWVEGVAATGTFTKAASMESIPSGSSGIPEGWTVQNYTDSQP